MESRNVKIVDEHGIDRDAHIIGGLKVANADYVLYSIERDGDNNNLFVSKIMNNFDGTSNMINIEDADEKNRLNSIVKELVTYAINNEADKTTGTVNLASGEAVTILPVVFNKEQNINVTKTYITTVKKNVTKVCEDYYDVPAPNTASQESTFFDTVKGDIFDEPVAAPVEAVSEPALPEVDTLSSPAPIGVEPAIPVPPVEEPVVAPVVPTPVQPASSPVTTPEPVVAPIFDTTPASPVAPANDLVFDASKETNLNQALGEVSSANTVPVDNVDSLREFGQSAPTVQESVAAPLPSEDIKPAVPAASGGFANKKFFMVIAILFFIAACVFLGYEAFMYFQLTK